MLCIKRLRINKSVRYATAGTALRRPSLGVAKILQEIAARISFEIGEPFEDLEAIDEALHTTRELYIYGKKHRLDRYDAITRSVAEQATNVLAQRVARPSAFDNILLTGGGAYLFKEAIMQRFPNQPIVDLSRSLYSNVCGFQRIGEQCVLEKPELF